MAQSEILKAVVKVGSDIKGLEKGMKKANKSINTFTKGAKMLTGALAGAFAVNKIADFTKEAVKMAGKFEGINRKFQTLGVSIEELRESVKGTVTDMELMQATNIAANLGLDVKQMGMLFQFAALRARETGEEVGKLVEKITKGIGRRSLLILDDLGLTAEQLKNEMKGAAVASASVVELTAAVGTIAKKALREAGDEAKTMGEELQTVKTAWQNLQLEIGRGLAISVSESSGFLDDLLGVITAQIQYKNLRAELHRQEKQAKKEQDEANKKSKASFDELLKAELFRLKVINDTTKAKEEEIKVIDKGFAKLETALPPERFKTEAEQIEDFFSKFTAIDDIIPQLTAVKQEIEGVTGAAEEYSQVWTDLSKAFQMMNTNNIASIRDYGNVVLDTIKKVIAAHIAEGISGAIKNALVSLPPGIGAAVAAISGATAAAMFKNLVPNFAEGGAAAFTKPTLSLLGEAPGISRSNPEIMGTAKQLKGMFGGGNGYIAETRISGADLKVILRRYDKEINTFA